MAEEIKTEGSVEKAETRKTFDEILSDKEYQSEFDKRIAKSLETAKAKWEKETEATHKTALEKAVAEATEPLNTKIKNLTITASINSFGVRDANDIIPHLDLNKVTINGENISGLEEQLTAIKEKKPYLFKEEEKPKEKEETPKAKTGLSHEGKPSGLDDADIRRTMRLPVKKG